VFMIIGQSAGAAAALAFHGGTSVQEVKYPLLEKVLLNADQVLKWDESLEDDPLDRMKKTFGKGGNIGSN
jgi:hypothetical protein